MGLTHSGFIEATNKCPVIPAIKSDEWLKACENSESELVYVIYGNICNISEIINAVKKMNKLAIVHLDLIEGLAGKEIAVDFIRQFTKADGIVTNKVSLVKRGKALDIFTIQRFFMSDALTYANIVKYIHNSNPDVVELLPAGMTKVISYLLQETQKPVIASGLILDKQDAMQALSTGVQAITTTNRSVWNA